MIPDLPGCMTQGETLEEVVINIEMTPNIQIAKSVKNFLFSLP